MHPDVHRDLFRRREAEIHARVLQQARNGDLARAIGETRMDERRTFLLRMWQKRVALRPAPLEP
jgi:hypothetical protein